MVETKEPEKTPQPKDRFGVTPNVEISRDIKHHKTDYVKNIKSGLYIPSWPIFFSVCGQGKAKPKKDAKERSLAAPAPGLRVNTVW